jgi:predicted ribosomally synthesized peptide with nif11-like leader
MNENVKMLNEKIKLDKEFAKKLVSLDTPEELQAYLKENEMEFSIEEMKTLKDVIKGKGGELSDDDLDGVAGGGIFEDIGGAIGGGLDDAVGVIGDAIK